MGFTFAALDSPEDVGAWIEGASTKKCTAKSAEKAKWVRSQKPESPSIQIYAKAVRGFLADGDPALTRDREAFGKYFGNRKGKHIIKNVRSVKDMTSEIIAYSQETQERLSTLIVSGHGYQGGICVGLGLLDPGHNELVKVARENFNDLSSEELGKQVFFDLRMHKTIMLVTGSSVKYWKKKLSELEDYIEVDGVNDCFNVLLLGCNTATDLPPDPSIVKVLADHLQEVFTPVKVFGADFEMLPEHTTNVLSKLEDVLRTKVAWNVTTMSEYDPAVAQRCKTTLSNAEKRKKKKGLLKTAVPKLLHCERRD